MLDTITVFCKLLQFSLLFSNMNYALCQ
uniref:Uncharacterized protein n=1 Tax=Arundo donax TaxID=35708 RepID=A0A0A9BKH6_ARUDO